MHNYSCSRVTAPTPRGVLAGLARVLECTLTAVCDCAGLCVCVYLLGRKPSRPHSGVLTTPPESKMADLAASCLMSAYGEKSFLTSALLHNSVSFCNAAPSYTIYLAQRSQARFLEKVACEHFRSARSDRANQNEPRHSSKYDVVTSCKKIYIYFLLILD